MGSQEVIGIFVETGKQRVFAGAVNWPGWCRGGKDESLAVQALLKAGARYADVLAGSDVSVVSPMRLEAFKVVDRVEGNSTTDFGAPDAGLVSDTNPVNPEELERFQLILRRCWQAFDRAVESALGKELRLGPRGGGRDLAKIIEHVIGSDVSYLGRIGWKAPDDAETSVNERLNSMREAVLEGMRASARGELPEKGPRGGLRWPARRFVRRVTWHVLDHAWEIEDRMGS